MPTDLQERHQTLTAHRTEAANRLNALEALARVQVLSDTEETEVTMLHSRLAHLQPMLEAAAREQVQEAERLDVETVCAEWGALVDTKKAAVLQFTDAVRYLRDCFQQLAQLHRIQEQAVTQLPRQVQERLMFPDGGSYAMRLVGTMKNPMGWQSVLLTPQPMEIPRPDDLMAVDAGCHALAPRVIERFLTGKA